jgi:hypothetical protein
MSNPTKGGKERMGGMASLLLAEATVRGDFEFASRRI